MSLPQTFIRNLNSSTTKWCVKVRVIRKYYVKSREEVPRDKSLEFVVHDAEGQRVHISVGPKLMSTFASTLDENKLYEITNFIVADNTAPFKTSSLSFKIILFTRTTLRQFSDANFPSHVFNFQPFASLADPQVDPSILIDVIGRLTTYSPPQTTNIKGKPTRVLDMTVENIEGATFACTLFGEMVEDVARFLGQTNVNVIVILQLSRLNTYLNEVRVQNTCHVSRVLLNPNLPEATNFQESIEKEGKPLLPIVPQSLPSTLSVEQDLNLTKDRYRTLSQLCEMNEAGYFWTFAQVTAVECKGEWCYNACRQCYRKMLDADEGYYCPNCSAENNEANWVYKVQVRVVDGTGDAPLTLWDKEVANIVGVTAEKLLDVNGIKSIPREIANIVGLEGLFNIKIEGSQRGGFLLPFPVKKLTTDANMINKFFHVEKNTNNNISEGELVTPILPPPNPAGKRKKIAPSVIVSLKRNLEDDFHKEVFAKKMKEALDEDDKSKSDKKHIGILEYNN